MKNLMMVCLLMILSVGLFAQEGLKMGLSFGPAFTSSKTEINGVSNSDLKLSGTGYRLALNGTYGFSENVSLYSGIGIVAKNTKSSDFKNNATYLEIPVGLRLRTSDLSSGVYAGALVAPTIDINLSSKAKSDAGEVDTKDFVKTFGLGMKFGLFAEKEFDFGRVMFMPAFNLGLTKVNAKEGSVDGQKTKMNYFELSLGYFF